jgi:hypothetical protein
MQDSPAIHDIIYDTPDITLPASKFRAYDRAGQEAKDISIALQPFLFNLELLICLKGL